MLCQTLPQEFMQKIVQRAEKESDYVHGINRVEAHKLKKIIAWARMPSMNLWCMDKEEQKEVINQLKQHNFIRVYNRKSFIIISIK